MSPGGRPLDYRGSEGWASRIITRSLTAGNLFCALCALSWSHLLFIFRYFPGEECEVII